MHFCTISLRNNLLATKQNDVTIIPSLLFSLVGFCSPQQVKFHVFLQLSTWERKMAIEILFAVVISALCILYQANKNISVIYTLNFNNHPILLRQEPIKWSLHLPYKPLESTLSRVDL